MPLPANTLIVCALTVLLSAVCLDAGRDDPS